MKNIVEMSFEWQSESNGFPADNLDRAKYARFLTNFLAAKGSEKNYVLNVNASWGAGKTWFLRRWSEEVKKNYPVVFVDAWKSDHSKDPFLSVVSAISKDLESLVDVRFKDSAITKKSWLLLKGIAPELTKGIVKKYLSLDIDEVSKAINNNDASSIAGVGAKAVEKLIKFHDETNSSIEDFKEATSQYLDLIINKSDKELPLFIFIDELDRCRPTYAIEMLETIKHIFDMDKVVFVIATDKGQLQHSIKAVYGQGFDSQRYLDRFFNRSITLKQFSLRELISCKVNKSKIFQDYCKDYDNFWFQYSGTGYVEDVINILTCAADSVGMDLRTSGYWFERLEAIISDGNKRIDIVFMSFIMALYSSNQSIYNEFTTSDFETETEVTNFCFKHLKFTEEKKIKIKSSDGMLCKAMDAEDSVRYYIKSSDFKGNYLSIIFNIRRLISAALNDEVLLRVRKSAMDKFQQKSSNYNSSVMMFVDKGASLDPEHEVLIADFYYNNKLSLVDFCDYSELATVLE